MHATTATSFGTAGSLEQFDAQSGSMDALVQCTEQETENYPVQDQRGRKPRVAATRPDQKSRCAQQADMDRDL